MSMSKIRSAFCLSVGKRFSRNLSRPERLKCPNGKIKGLTFWIVRVKEMTNMRYTPYMAF